MKASSLVFGLAIINCSCAMGMNQLVKSENEKGLIKRSQGESKGAMLSSIGRPYECFKNWIVQPSRSKGIIPRCNDQQLVALLIGKYFLTCVNIGVVAAALCENHACSNSAMMSLFSILQLVQIGGIAREFMGSSFNGNVLATSFLGSSILCACLAMNDCTPNNKVCGPVSEDNSYCAEARGLLSLINLIVAASRYSMERD